MTDPGGYWPAIARLSMGLCAPSSWSASQSAVEIPPTNTLGEKVGLLAMARISPLVQSMTMAEPPTESMPVSRILPTMRSRDSSAVRWMSTSSVSTRSDPLCGSMLVERPSTSP